MKIRALLVLAILSLASAATAQTFRAQFTASADHAVVVNATPLLTSYDLVIATLGNPTVPLVTVDLGKPAPTAQNTITVEFTAEMQALPRNAQFVGRVIAKGPGGASSTPNSAPFFGLTGAPAAPTAAPVITVTP
jgi:hypothetical protein